MITSIMLYMLAVAALVSGAALVLEYLIGGLKRPRRYLWLGALSMSLLLPGLRTLIGDESVTTFAAGPQAPIVDVQGQQQTSSPTQSAEAVVVATPGIAWPKWGSANTVLAFVWFSSSFAMAAVLAVAAWLLRRRMRLARRCDIAGCRVRVLGDEGPAVFGFFAPEIVVPEWLVTADPRLQRSAILHERAHLAAHDQITLVLALLVVIAAPWNLALWWQLKRLRAAIEIDCDARVLAAGIGTTDYADALVAMRRQSIRSPLGAIALIEPVTQLERRVRIMLRRTAIGKPMMAISAIAAAALLTVACAVNAPALDALVKPPPNRGGGMPGPLARVGELVMAQYGSEIRNGDQPFTRVELSYDDDGLLTDRSIEFLDEVPPLGPPLQPPSDGEPAFRFLVCVEVLEGAARCAGEPGANERSRMVAVGIYGNRLNLESLAVDDTVEIDRQIAERYFPDVFTSPPPANLGHWVLADHDGTIVAVGRDPLSANYETAGAPIEQISRLVAGRFPNAEIEIVRVSPLRERRSQVVVDRAGENVRLFTAWLAEESPAL